MYPDLNSPRLEIDLCEASLFYFIKFLNERRLSLNVSLCLIKQLKCKISTS